MNIKIPVALIAVFAAPFVYGYGQLKPMTDEEIRANILNGLLKSYEQECPCPFSKDSQNQLCGDDSDYFKSRGRVMCYTSDIADSDVAAYRQKYNVIDPISDPNYQYTSPANVYKQREQPLEKEQIPQNGGGFSTNR
ncbi:MAG: hypothetical protein HYX61_03375 [Gammaproteobacteria bacterium]|jgi:hypothetical protein|nr:hypothetical protein [Gammaproteobacteria bacterium]